MYVAHSTRFHAVVVLLLCFGATVTAQQDGMQMSLDLSTFRYDATQSYVELSYSFPRSSLSYERVDDTWQGAILINTIITSEGSGGADPSARMWRVPVVMRDTAGMMEKTLVGVVNYLLAPGKYRMTVIARDEREPRRSDSIVIPYDVRAFPMRGTAFSDVQLCASIQRAERDSANIFYKNTLEVIPNPTLLYGKGMPTLMYYAELYNADQDAYVIKTDVISSYGKTMATRGNRKTGRAESRVEVGSLHVGALPSGSYTFILALADTAGTVRLSRSKPFYVYNPDVPLDTAAAREVASSIALEFAALGENELNEQFAIARYTSTDDERNLWGNLSGAEAKKKFLTRFWNDRDPDPVTPRNEGYELYMDKVRTANQQFRTAYRPGWRTDRGRVYITYGPADYIERFSNESDAKPYEVWRYDNIQSGVDFYFVDKGGFGEYELVHSTMRNEINNPDWQRHIQTR